MVSFLRIVSGRPLNYNSYSAYVSMQRIQAFLSEPEVEDWACGIKRDEETPGTPPDDDKIGFRNASFRWHWNLTELEDPLERDNSTFMLSDITIDIPLGKLTLVTGVTGSGKSSLLAALLGGKLIYGHCRAFVYDVTFVRNGLCQRTGVSRQRSACRILCWTASLARARDYSRQHIVRPSFQ